MCDSLDSGAETGPMQINYLEFYYCRANDYPFFAVCLLLLWSFYLISLLGSTATNYFSSTLASICGKLKLSPDLAGVTFLAFGNGAPDVFSSIASIGGGANPLIGIGSVLGGSVFVTTIVVGSVAIICPCDVSPIAFTRDIMFYIVTACMLGFITITGKVTATFAMSLFFVYVTYVLVVWVSAYYQSKWDEEKRVSSQANKIISTAIQTAYWYKPENSSQSSSRSVKSVVAPKLPSRRNGYSFLESQDFDDNDDEDDEETTYKFLILDESVDKRKDEAGAVEEDSMVINLSGGLMASEFSALIIEDYFDPIRGKFGMANKMLSESKPIFSSTAPLSSSSMRSQTETFSIGDESDSLTTSLLGSEPIEFSDSAKIPSAPSQGQRLKPKMLQKKSVASKLYWQQVMLQRRFQRRFLSAEWWTMPTSLKLLVLAEFPAVLARDFTIPTIDEEMWNKTYALIQPTAAFLFLLLVTGQLDDHVGAMPVWPLFLFAGFFLSAVVYFTTHHSYPPKNFLFSTFWALFSFVMCIVWIYTLAGELVNCLTALGAIFNIPPIYLGLTVLAWGNSIGDLFANIAVAKRGLGQMALAGCYAGPVFDILVGLSIALSIACSNSYPKPFEIAYDSSSTVSFIFLVISLSSTLIVVTVRGHHLERWFGYFLFGLYGLHGIVQGILLVSS